MSDRIAAYEAHLARLRRAERPLVSYCCPQCGARLHALRPDPGQSHSTMVDCAYCTRLHYRVIRSDGRIDLVLDGCTTHTGGPRNGH